MFWLLLDASDPIHICCCCLPCNHCSNWTWGVLEFLAFGTRLRSTHCREFKYLKLCNRTSKFDFFWILKNCSILFSGLRIQLVKNLSGSNPPIKQIPIFYETQGQEQIQPIISNALHSFLYNFRKKDPTGFVNSTLLLTVVMVYPLGR